MKTMKDGTLLLLTVKQLIKAIENGEMVFDNAVQRPLVWKNEEKSLLVNSILFNFPITYAYSNKVDDKYDMIDGKQRYNAIFEFSKDKFALSDFKEGYKEYILADGTEFDLKGKKFSDFPDELKDVFYDYRVEVKVYDDAPDEFINEMFYRLNNGKALTAITKARSRAVSLKEIRLIGEHKLFKLALTPDAIAKYNHEDLVIKSYIMLNSEEPCYDAKTVRSAMETAHFNESDINMYNQIYDRIYDAYNYIQDNTTQATEKVNKKILKRLITKTHLLSIIPIVKKSIDDGISMELFAKWAENFYSGMKKPTKYEKYNSKSSGGNARADAVRDRLEVISKDFEKFIKLHQHDDIPKANIKDKENTSETNTNEENMSASSSESDVIQTDTKETDTKEIVNNVQTEDVEQTEQMTLDLGVTNVDASVMDSNDKDEEELDNDVKADKTEINSNHEDVENEYGLTEEEELELEAIFALNDSDTDDEPIGSVLAQAELEESKFEESMIA